MDGKDFLLPSADITGERLSMKEDPILKEETDYVRGVLHGIPVNNETVYKLAERIAGLRQQVETFQAHLTSAVETGLEEKERVATLQEHLTSAVEEGFTAEDRALMYDEKFKILNSVGLKKELKYAIDFAKRYNVPLSAAFIDLKGLKPVNEHPELGQSAGDEAIRVVIEAFRSNLRETDRPAKPLTSEEAKTYISEIAAKEGGDEFVVLYLGTPLEGGIAATKRVLDAIPEISDKRLPKHREIFGRPLSARAGVAQFDPVQDKDGEGFLRRIGGAMYKTKKREGIIGVSAPVYKEGDFNTVIIRNFKPGPSRTA